MKVALGTWGFSDNLASFSENLDAQWRAAITSDTPARQKWVRAQEQWVREGDTLLRRLTSVFADEEGIGMMSPEGLAEVWSELTGIAYIIMYMLTAIEARLELMII